MANPNSLSNEDRASLVAYLDGELDEAAAREWEVRLNTDAVARAEADSLRRAWELLDCLPQPQPSAAFATRTVDSIAVLKTVSVVRWTRARRWGLGAAWAAGLLIAATTGYIVFRHRSLSTANEPATSPPPITVDLDPQLAHNLRLLDNLDQYEAVEDLKFLQELDRSELFGDEG
jgi:anti-sigma factor RsiW